MKKLKMIFTMLFLTLFMSMGQALAQINYRNMSDSELQQTITTLEKEYKESLNKSKSRDVLESLVYGKSLPVIQREIDLAKAEMNRRKGQGGASSASSSTDISEALRARNDYHANEGFEKLAQDLDEKAQRQRVNNVRRANDNASENKARPHRDLRKMQQEQRGGWFEVSDEDYLAKINHAEATIKSEIARLENEKDTLAKYLPLYEKYLRLACEHTKEMKKQLAVIAYQANYYWLIKDKKFGDAVDKMSGAKIEFEKVANLSEEISMELTGDSVRRLGGTTDYYRRMMEKDEKELLAFGYTKEQAAVFRKVVDEQLGSPVEKVLGKFTTKVFVQSIPHVMPVATDSSMGKAVSTGVSKGLSAAGLTQDVAHVLYYRNALKERDAILKEQAELEEGYKMIIQKLSSRKAEVDNDLDCLNEVRQDLASMKKEKDSLKKKENYLINIKKSMGKYYLVE